MQDSTKWDIVLRACIFLLAGSLIVVIVHGLRVDEVEKAPVQVRKLSPVEDDAELRKRLQEAREYVEPTHEEKIRAIITGHQAKAEQNPDAPETPGLLMAMGNLYRLELKDYAQAAYCYQQVISRFPEYPGLMSVYPELAACYEEAGDNENMIRVYMEMLSVFPENTEQHLFARTKLQEVRWEEGEGRQPRVYNDDVSFGPQIKVEGEPETEENDHG